ncbi:arylsulfatase B [Nephila pilipes]|uniref:Arylsulfatase B n=1 Tax=Nephila pilipes TaxID=299642 RepID=A0A8X6NK30_NEPPI|nr:arylsulfatase B [Nephila pilipes]
MYADDLGYNDVSYNGYQQIPTPNIDALASHGKILRNYYGEWLCTPSRGSLFTGKYASRLGLQHFIIKGGEDSALPINETTLAERLKELGYDTHMIGKWHLGYSRNEYLPTNRGFDTFFGYLNGLIGYYDHTYYANLLDIPNQPVYFGRDLFNGSTLAEGREGEYATDMFTESAEDIIMNHDTSKPFFMYMAHLAVHTGNSFKKMEAPPEVIEKFKYIKDINRRIHAAVVSVLDDSVGIVFNTLYKKGMLDCSIVLFISDNGGEVDPRLGFGSNYPLRGNKMTFWEGAVHLPALIWTGPQINLGGSRISKQLMHVCDWLPTLYGAAGGNVEDLGPIDGTSSFRLGDMKIVSGLLGDANYWFEPREIDSFNRPSSYEWVFKNGSIVKDVLVEMGMWDEENTNEIYQALPIQCIKPPPDYAYNCQPEIKPCLFNITADPCEYSDLADAYPELVNEMMDIIDMYQDESMPPQSKLIDPRADPMCHNFQYVPWLEPEYYNECSYAE